MNKKTIFHIGILTVIASALFFGLSAIHPSAPPRGETPKEHAEDTATISMTIAGLYDHMPVSITPGETVIDTLRSLDADDPNIRLVTKEYPGLGILVLAMAGKVNGTNDNYWQYEVNGTMPQIGADTFELRNGDTVEWFFRPSEF